MEKITKDTYGKLIKGNHYYVESVYDSDLKSVSKLMKNNSIEHIIKHSTEYKGTVENMKWFIHKAEDGNDLYEEKKGKFYLESLDDRLILYHTYDDGIITVKVI